MNYKLFALGACALPLAAHANHGHTGLHRAGSSVVIVESHAKKIFLRLESISDDVVRAWYSSSNRFVRKPSLALEGAPKSRSTFKVRSSDTKLFLETAKLLVTVDRGTLAIDVEDLATHRLILANLGLTDIQKDGKWIAQEKVATDEHLLGLGQDNRNHGKLERRGTIRELWAGQQIKSGNVTAEYSIPFMVSAGHQRHAYGVYLDDVYRLRYDLAKTNPNQVKIEADGGNADFYVIDGPTPKEVVSRYTALTGRPSLLPLWCMGYIQSRCVFYNWSDIDAAYSGLRSRGYPVDAMVIDYSWPEVLNDYVWDKRWTVGGVTPGTRVEDYRKKGVKIVMSISGPMLQKDSPTFAPGVKAGVFATDGHGNHLQAGYYGGDLLDFTSPNMNAWLWPQLRPRNMEGVAGWWLDLIEPEGEPPQTVYSQGTSANVHNKFANLVARSYEGSLLHDHPNVRPFLLGRAGSAGIQREFTALWTGDINSDYATLAAHPGEMLNSAISGLNAWTCDTGGFLTGYYKNDRYGAHARLYERWMQFSVFSPITRAHKAGLCMPYEFGPATEQGANKYLNLRYRLLPYIYSHDYEASQTGIPLVRSMGLEFPEDPHSAEVAGDQYMFGKNLLVAPVLHEAISRRPVYVPAGKWIDWDYGYQYQGGKTWIVQAPQNRIPVLVRPGAIIPMAPDMANTAVGKWDPITVQIFPSGVSNFSMFQDDGRTFNYRKGDDTITRFQSVQSGARVQFTISTSNRKFVPHRYILRFHLDQAPTGITLDGTKLPMTWDSKTRILTMNVDSNSHTKRTVSVALSAVVLPIHSAPLLSAEKISADAGSASAGGPTPHFFPGPSLPTRIRAVDYDNGGEGVAYHQGSTAIATSPYRSDNLGIARASDLGGYVLQGLHKDDWVRYSVDARNGGYFKLVVRAMGADAKFRLLADDRYVVSPVTLSQNVGWQTIEFPNVYLNPGVNHLMVFVDGSPLNLDSLDFQNATTPPSIYLAEWAAHTGQVVSSPSVGGVSGSLYNVGQLTGSVTMGVGAVQAGSNRLLVRYANGGKEITLHLSVNEGKPMDVTFPNTGGGSAWKDLELTLPLEAGANRLTLTWTTDKYDSIALQSIELKTP
jgi:alpha-glucosidase